MFFAILGFMSLAILLSSRLYAYIDPGSGSYFVQMAIAFVGSFALFFSKPLLEIKKKLFKKDPDNTPELRDTHDKSKE